MAAFDDDDTPTDEIWPGADLFDGDGEDDDYAEMESDDDDDPMPMAPDYLGADLDDDIVDDNQSLVTSWKEATPEERTALWQDEDFLQSVKNKGYVLARQTQVAESAPPDANGRLSQRAAEIARLLYP